MGDGLAAPPATPPSPWQIETPEILPETDPSFLCETCRQLDFRYLLYGLPYMQCPDIPLGTLDRALSTRCCAFCRLVQAAVDNVYGADFDVMPREYEGKPIMLSLMPFPEGLDASKPRHLVLHLRPSPWKGAPGAWDRRLQVQLVDKDAFLEHDGIGRVVDPTKLNNIVALYWIRTCRMGYGLHKEDESSKETIVSSKPPAGFRLIDLKRNCIVPAEESSYDYVTLSYVWPPPGRQILKLLASNKDEVIGPDGCLVDPQRPFASKIPQTIKDAMEICRSVGEGYLWVDALCIIQDDDADRDSQIRAMDYIYSSSALTLASTCGDGAEASIPRTPGRAGTTTGTRPSIVQTIASVQGFQLANRAWAFDRSVENTKWNTRAWTFQERALSKRTLFVTEQQMFFKCRHSPSYLAEDLDTAPKRRALVTYPMDDTGTDVLPTHGSINMLTYGRTVEHFTTRDITYTHDILNAFTGITERMRTIFRSGFVYGLPRSELDCALMWQPAGAMQRRICANGVEFPSWSWAGWLGSVRYPFENCLPRVRWVHHETGQLLSPDDYRCPATGRLEWRQEWTEKRSHSGFRYFYHSSDEKAWFRNPTSPESQRTHEGPSCVPSTPGHLRFETEVVDVTLGASFTPASRDIDEATNPTWGWPLNDDGGHAIGFFNVLTRIAKEMSGAKTYKFVRISRIGHGLSVAKIKSKKGDPTPAGEDDSLEDEFVFEKLDGDPDLVREEPLPSDKSGSVEEWAYQLPFDRLRYDPLRPFCLNEFLVVEMVGGVAYRIGTGRVHVDAWAQEPPKTEIITLG